LDQTMLAVSFSNSIAGIGWMGIFAFVVVLVGYQVAVRGIGQWVFGANPSRGHRLTTGLSAAAALLGIGAIVRTTADGPDGEILLVLNQAGYGGACGLALGVWSILMSVRRADSNETIDAPDSLAAQRSSLVVGAPKWMPSFHATVVGFVAVCFIGFGFVAVGAAANGIGKDGWIFGLFGGFAVLAGLVLARLAWKIHRRRAT
jgi:hypothetical protein